MPPALPPAVTPTRFDLVKAVSARLVIVLAVWVGLAVLFLVVGSTVFHWLPVLVVTLWWGVLGGFIGLQRHIKSLGFNDLRLLSESWYYVILPPLTGGFLAVVLYCLFISGLLRGDLFPSFKLDAADLAKRGTLIFNDLMAVRAVKVQDYAKLVVWSFIAGFSEKFVINILGQFHAKTSEPTAVEEGDRP